MAFKVEHVKSLLQRDLVTELEKVKADIIAKISYSSLTLVRLSYMNID